VIIKAITIAMINRVAKRSVARMKAVYKWINESWRVLFYSASILRSSYKRANHGLDVKNWWLFFLNLSLSYLLIKFNVIYSTVEFVLILALKFISSTPYFSESHPYTEEITWLFSIFYKLKFAQIIPKA
jgi:hypothetical protein